MSKLRRIAVSGACLVLLTSAALVLGGCSVSSAGRTSAAAPAPNAIPVAGPTIDLVTPAAGVKIPAGDVSMSVKTTGLKFVTASNTNVAGEGHVHFTLDGQPFKMSVSPDYVYVGVAPGPHQLQAELVQNDTKPFDPPVKQEITFTAE